VDESGSGPTLAQIQGAIPWGDLYTAEFKASQEAEGHRHLLHAVVHAQKALGVLAAFVEQFDHARAAPLSDIPRRQLADLVICAARIANTSQVSLERAIIERLMEKNPGWVPPW
jgi:hypothetical protein